MARRTAVVWAAEDTAASLHAQYRTEPVRVQRLCGWGWIREALKGPARRHSSFTSIANWYHAVQPSVATVHPWW